jgi:hypothetical protein
MSHFSGQNQDFHSCVFFPNQSRTNVPTHEQLLTHSGPLTVPFATAITYRSESIWILPLGLTLLIIPKPGMKLLSVPANALQKCPLSPSTTLTHLEDQRNGVPSAQGTVRTNNKSNNFHMRTDPNCEYCGNAEIMQHLLCECEYCF